MTESKTTYIMPDQGGFGGNNDIATLALLGGGGGFGANGWMNNPFMYLIWAYMMRWMNGGEWGNGNVRRLTDGIGEEAHGDALAGKTTHLHLGLHRGIALQARYGHEVHEIEREFAQFGNLALYEDSHLFRVQTASQIVQRHLDDILAHLLRIVNIIGQGLCIGNKDIHLVVIALVLQLHTTAEATHVMTNMKPARRTVAGKYYSLV